MTELLTIESSFRLVTLKVTRTIVYVPCQHIIVNRYENVLAQSYNEFWFLRSQRERIFDSFRKPKNSMEKLYFDTILVMTKSSNYSLSSLWVILALGT